MPWRRITDDGDGELPVMLECWSCNGTGMACEALCRMCGGQGGVPGFPVDAEDVDAEDGEDPPPGRPQRSPEGFG